MGLVHDYDTVVKEIINAVQTFKTQQPVPSKPVVMDELVFVAYHLGDLLVQLLSVGGCKFRVIARLFNIHEPRAALVQYKFRIFAKSEHGEKRLFVFSLVASRRVIQT